MPILGLISAESFSTERFKNVRRSVFYNYPNGQSPLMGLLSLMAEEVTNDPEYQWYEKRLVEQWTTTAVIATTVCFATGITITAGVISAQTTASGDITFTQGTLYAVKCSADPTAKFRIGHVIRMSLYDTAGKYQEVIGRVEGLNNSTASPANEIGFRALETVGTAVDYDHANNTGAQVLVAGSAYAEGAVDESTGIYNLPVKQLNYTQIFRTPFTITGTALKTSAKFDETGTYKDMSKENSTYHMIELEKAFMFGTRYERNSSGTMTRFTGGVLWFLRQWEAGSTYGNTAATANSDDNKRILTSLGSITESTFNGYTERLFRVMNNKANEKLGLCGSGFLSIINQAYKNKTMMTADLPLTDTYGMSVVKHQTPFGVIYWKTHPLFSQNPSLRNSALFLDVNNLKYRYLAGRDTELLTDRQANDADYRKDEWLTECGLQTILPESHMFMDGLTAIT